MELTIESRITRKATVEPDKLAEAAAVLANLCFKITEVDGIEVTDTCTDCGMPILLGEEYETYPDSVLCSDCSILSAEEAEE